MEYFSTVRARVRNEWKPNFMRLGGHTAHGDIGYNTPRHGFVYYPAKADGALESTRISYQQVPFRTIARQTFVSLRALPYSVGSCFKVVFRILPVALRGSAGMKTIFLGSL